MERIISLCGLLVMMLLAWLMSSHKRAVDKRVIVGGLALQFGLALFLLHSPPGLWFFDGVGRVFQGLLSCVDAGSSFLFEVHARPGDEGMPSRIVLLRTFAFGILPTVIFFSSFMSVLYYLRIMQVVVYGMAWVMQRTLRTSGAESLAAAANVFVGHTEAPLVIRPYLPAMTYSELNALMIGGFATITGGLMAVFAGMGIHPGHLMTASLISAPAALLIAKIMEPEREQPVTRGGADLQLGRRGVNVIEAAAIGASEGLKLALNIAAMLIAFLALLALVDLMVGWVGWQFGFRDNQGRATWTLARGLGYAFAPLAWLMGIEWADCLRAGELLGLKMVTNEVIAYDQMSQWLRLPAPPLSPRTQVILTYALCGFSNFGAIGIQLGGIGALAPDRRPDLARLGLRAMLGGTLACCMTACVAGILL
jgi:concentrative nucleoside transporter, CNT family